MKMILAVIFLVTATVSRAQNMCNTSYGAFTAMSSNCSDAVEAVIQFYVQFGPDPDDLATACSAECEALWRPVLTDCGSVSLVHLCQFVFFSVSVCNFNWLISTRIVPFRVGEKIPQRSSLIIFTACTGLRGGSRISKGGEGGAKSKSRKGI